MRVLSYPIEILFLILQRKSNLFIVDYVGEMDITDPYMVCSNVDYVYGFVIDIH